MLCRGKVSRFRMAAEERKTVMNRSLGLIVVFGLTGVSGCAHLSEQRFLARWKGKPAPDFALQDLKGQTVRLSDHRGKPVVVAFFAYG